MSSIILVATLIADPARERLSEASLDQAAAALRGAERRRWLDHGVAADIVFTGELAPKRAALLEALAGAPCDVIVQPLAGREKRLLVADMDSTLVGQESLDALAAVAGVGEHAAAITERARRGDIAFEPALRRRVGLLARLPAAAIDAALAKITLNPGARTLVQTMKARGARVAVVSSGFRPFTRAVAARLGADEDRANAFEIIDGKLTGRAIEPVLGGDGKLAALRDIAQAMDLDLSEMMAVGDGADDLPMLSAAGLGVAYRGKPRVAAAADARIDNGDLTALLYAQGIRRKEFVEG